MNAILKITAKLIMKFFVFILFISFLFRNIRQLVIKLLEK